MEYIEKEKEREREREREREKRKKSSHGDTHGTYKLIYK